MGKAKKKRIKVLQAQIARMKEEIEDLNYYCFGPEDKRQEVIIKRELIERLNKAVEDQILFGDPIDTNSAY